MNINSSKVRIEDLNYHTGYTYNPIKQEDIVLDGNFKKENSIKSIAINKINNTIRNFLILMVLASFVCYYFAMVSEYNLNNLSHQISTLNDENAELENDLNKLKSLRNVDSKISQSKLLQKAGQVMQVSAVKTSAPETKKVKVSSTFDWAVGY